VVLPAIHRSNSAGAVLHKSSVGLLSETQSLLSQAQLLLSDVERLRAAVQMAENIP
jgi:hypothetical protein